MSKIKRSKTFFNGLQSWKSTAYEMPSPTPEGSGGSETTLNE